MRPNAPFIFLATVAIFAAVFAAPAAAEPPVGAITWEPAAPYSGQQVVFTASFSDADGPVTVQGWDLNHDDNFTEDAGPTAARSYAHGDDYDVAVLLSDGVEDPVKVHATITVLNRPPLASIAVIPNNPVVGQELTFVSTSTDSDGAIGGQSWDLDGDGFDDGDGVYVTTTFSEPGRYTIRLRTFDRDEHQGFAVAEVDVIVGTPGGGGGQVIGASSLRLMTPFPIVRMSGLVRSRGIRLRLLTVNAPIGASISFRCRGRGCPFKHRTRVVKPPKKSSGIATAGQVRIRRFPRRVVRAGAFVSVYVTKPGSIGKYTRFRVRRGRPPARRDRCMPPSGTAPIPCPAG